MSDEGWVVQASDGRSREVSTLDEAERVKSDLEDLGLDVNIKHLNEDENDNNGVETDDEPNPVSQNISDEIEEIGPTLIQPADVDKSNNLYEKYERLKAKLIDSEDIQDVDGSGRFIKKSGWRKIATAFNLNVEVIEYEREVDNDVLRYTVKARSTAPNGKTATAIAIAQSTEPKFTEVVSWENKTENDQRNEFDENPDIVRIDGAYRRVKHPKEVNEHDLITLAATRAKNRAISDLVGGGELSAEEIKK